MKFSRLATALVLGSALALTACAPPTANSGNSGKGGDEAKGTVRVWLFSEVNQDPKSAVVKDAIKDFEATHQGSTVDVQYIAVDTRAERFKAAFNDPSSAPDVAEFGNTDMASYVAAGGLSDVDDLLGGWDEAKDFAPKILDTTRIEGKSYAVPWFIGVRALYYRTDLFEKAGLTPPKTLAEVETAARTIRAKNPELLGMAVGGKAQFVAMPYLWANGGDIATEEGGKFTSALTSEKSRAGITAYTNLLRDDICPAQTCAQFGGDASVKQFIAGKAGMALGGDFNYKAVSTAPAVKDKFKVIPLPGTTEGSIAPAFAGGNNLGIFKSTKHKSLAADFVKILAGKKYQQKMFDAMGNLSTFSDVQQSLAEKDPNLKPFVDTLAAGTRFVPVTEAWGTIDAQGLFTGMYQKIASGKADVNGASQETADAMNKVFGSTK